MGTVRRKLTAGVTDEHPLIGVWFEIPEQTIPLPVRGRGERALIHELICGALHDLDSPAIQVQENAAQWILKGDTGAINARDACDFVGVDYEALRIRVEAGLVFRRRRRGSSLAPSVVVDTNLGYSEG